MINEPMLLPAFFLLCVSILVMRPFYKSIVTGMDIMLNKRRFSSEKVRVNETSSWCNVVMLQKCCNVYQGGRMNRKVLRTHYEMRFENCSSFSLMESGVVKSRPYGFIDALEWKPMFTEEHSHATWYEYSRPKLQEITVILKAGTSRADLELVALTNTSLLNFKRQVLVGFATSVGLITFLLAIALLSLMKMCLS